VRSFAADFNPQRLRRGITLGPWMCAYLVAHSRGEPSLSAGRPESVRTHGIVETSSRASRCSHRGSTCQCGSHDDALVWGHKISAKHVFHRSSCLQTRSSVIATCSHRLDLASPPSPAVSNKDGDAVPSASRFQARQPPPGANPAAAKPYETSACAARDRESPSATPLLQRQNFQPLEAS